MVREFKFRAWNGKIFRYYPLGISISNIDRFEISQYTGLKDSKDIEIYEGDILNLINWDAVEPDLFVDAERKVEFRDGCFIVSDEESGYCNIDMVELSLCEIVGNVYKKEEK